MKQADVIRLGLAYVLIAASGRDAKEPVQALEVATSRAAGAKSPVEVPARGWVDIARSVWTKIGKNRVIAVAAGLTFYGLLAIFPTVTALVSVYGLFADPASINAQLQNLAGIVPEGAISIIGDQVQRISTQGASTLGFAFVAGLLAALWSANSGVKALFDALNVAVRGRRDAWVLSAERNLAAIHDLGRATRRRRAVADNRHSLDFGTFFLWSVFCRYNNTLAEHTACHRRRTSHAGGTLPVRPRDKKAGLALGHAWELVCGRFSYYCLCRLCVLRRPLWQLQQNLWQPWSRDRLYDVALDILHRRYGRGRD